MTEHPKAPNWIIPLVIAGLVALLGGWGNYRLREAIEDELKSDLSATLDANVTALEIWTTNQMKMATMLAEEPVVRNLAGRLLAEAPVSRGEFLASTNLQELADFLRPRLSRLGYETAQLVNTDCLVVATSNRGRFGLGQPVAEAQTNKFIELFNSGQPVIITPFKPELQLVRRPARLGGTNFFFPRTNRPALLNRARGRRGDIQLMQVAAPLTYRGTVRGALALIINPTNEFTRILSVARRGNQGETYAFDQTGLLISQSRFDTQLKALGLLGLTNTTSALNLRLNDPGGDLTRGYRSDETNLAAAPLIRIVSSALAGEDGVEVVPSRDYRGVPVVGAWRWLPQLGIGIATELPAAEAFWLLHVLQFIFISLFLLLVLCAVVLFGFSYANLAWRRRLNEAELKLKQLGQYTLEEKIGAGSMGVVYRARHALLRRDTAVKLLLPALANPASIAKFEREVRLTCQLAHPNTIQIYDYGHTPEGVFYYAMEFLAGLNLRELVDRFGPLPEGRVVNLLTQICNSLAEAHALGLVHRDIKPSNVFLSDRGGVPDYVKVLDFGLVREFQAGERQADDAEMAGTPWFMPPEAIRDPGLSDPRSDLYAVGGLGYYLLTGRHVFEHESAVEVLENQLHTCPVPPSQVTVNPISPALEAVILRCLEKDPALRPQSALELAALLLASPHAADSTPENRAAWWRDYHAQLNLSPAPAEAGSDSTLTEVNIDFKARAE